MLPQAPVDIFNAAAQMDIPLLTGSNAREYADLPPTVDREGWIQEARSECGIFADRFLRAFDPIEGDLTEVAGAARADRIYVWQNWKMARAHAHCPPTLLLLPLEPRATCSSGGRICGEGQRCLHGVELPYVFRHLQVFDWPWEDVDRALENVVSSYWLNFAHSGDPNGSDLPEWSALDPGVPRAMRFGAPSGTKCDRFRARGRAGCRPERCRARPAARRWCRHAGSWPESRP